ncbi:MAG: arginine repressor [Candidatus Woesearchaeota archaeon]
MARNQRQNKILEIISDKDIETQTDLVTQLKKLKYNITQATVSRDIKELGLIKTLSNESGKYKYTFVESDKNSNMNGKFSTIFKDSIIKVQPAQNLVVIKTLKGMAEAVTNYIDQLHLENSLGTVSGNDTVMITCKDNDCALLTYEQIMNML